MSNNRKAERIHARLRKEFPSLIILCYPDEDGRDLVIKATCDDLPELLVREWFPLELDGNTLFRLSKGRIENGVLGVYKTRQRDKEWVEEIDAHNERTRDADHRRLV